jgi:hypothetical protein
MCALGLSAFGGTASADKPNSPGCKGAFTSGTAQEGGGLDPALDTLGLSHEEFRDMREEFCPDEEPF